MAKGKGGDLHIPISDHRAIRRDTTGQFGVRAEVNARARVIKTIATGIAGEYGEPSNSGDEGYSMAEHMGTDRVRVNIWADNDTTERAERDIAPLQQAAMRVQ